MSLKYAVTRYVAMLCTEGPELQSRQLGHAKQRNADSWFSYQQRPKTGWIRSFYQKLHEGGENRTWKYAILVGMQVNGHPDLLTTVGFWLSPQNLDRPQFDTPLPQISIHQHTHANHPGSRNWRKLSTPPIIGS
jgi:hypothetical protein